MSLAHQIIPAGEGKGDGLALDLIQIDGGTQSRANLNDQVVADYASAIEDGASFPAIVVFYDGKKYWLADGFHRFHAFQKAGRKTIPADVRQGTRRDAILHSVGANASHGLRRTNDDKRRAVLTLLNDAEWGKWTDREIARRCAVGPDMVGRLRPADTVAERQYVHPKTGKPTTMKTAGINASRKNAPEGPQLNDEPSPEAGPQAEASHVGTDTGTPADREGRRDGEAAPVDLPTNSEDIEAIRAGHIVQYHVAQLRSAWSKANDEAKAIFLAETNLSFIAEPADAAVAAGNDLREPTAAASGQIIREGDAPRETGRFGGDASSPDAEFETPANPSAPQARQADRAGEVNPPASPATHSALSKAETGRAGGPVSAPIKRLRPHCLHPEMCASGTREHCWSCRKQMAESEAA